ncbi:hypothetical protein GA0061101_106155 [Rhizobium lusitanum]|uniref:HNH endonuclease n=1 Tax=Rhizobium lusitanum TaxID=293958 RepID=A0A1C3VSS2_9HYPH|nr:hypothetical protein GA0061101_106155 [Rhizobium lusitanum]
MNIRFKPCSVNDCARNSHTDEKGCRGFCYPHYQRFMRNGDPEAGWASPGDAIRFVHESAVHYNGTDCLIWPFSRSGNNYGQLKIDGKHIGAHRYVCIVVYGEPPEPELVAAHSCGNGHLGCVAPRHLSWKTQEENSADKLSHGTHNRGERNARAKLSNDQARQILSLKGSKTQKEIALMFGITHSTVSEIHRGTKWGWLNSLYRKEKEVGNG